MILNENVIAKKSLKKENSTSINLIKLVEAKFLKNISENLRQNIEIGDVVRIGYLIQEVEKYRIQFHEGVVIAKRNKGLGKSFTIRKIVQNIGVEQIFLFHSPKIISITKKQSSKVRRAKLYYLRKLSGKATKLKIKL